MILRRKRELCVPISKESQPVWPERKLPCRVFVVAMQASQTKGGPPGEKLVGLEGVS